jgi:hypothetical protein
MPFDTDLGSLEIAGLYAEQGRTEEIKRLALEMIPVGSGAVMPPPARLSPLDLPEDPSFATSACLRQTSPFSAKQPDFPVDKVILVWIGWFWPG